MATSLFHVFVRNRLSTSRRLSLYNQWKPLLVADGLIRIGAYLARARAHDQETQALEVRWKTRESVGVYGTETVALDNTLDHVIVATHDMVAAYVRGFPAGHVKAAAAERVMAEAFPLGLKAVVSAPFVDEAAEVERIVAKFDDSLTAEVALLGITDLVDRLRTVGGAYREAVDDGNQRMVFAQVQEAQERGMSYVAELLVQILAVYHDTDDPASVAARNRYLMCLYEQEERERKQRRARRSNSEPGDEPGDVPTGDEGDAPTGDEGDAPTGDEGDAPTGDEGDAPTDDERPEDDAPDIAR